MLLQADRDRLAGENMKLQQRVEQLQAVLTTSLQLHSNTQLQHSSRILLVSNFLSMNVFYSPSYFAAVRVRPDTAGPTGRLADRTAAGQGLPSSGPEHGGGAGTGLGGGPGGGAGLGGGPGSGAGAGGGVWTSLSGW